MKNRAASRRLPDTYDPYSAIANGDFEEAAEQAARTPGRASRLLLADLALRERRPEDAIDLLSRWRAHGDEETDARRNLLLATAFERVGLHERAEELYALTLPRTGGWALENQRLHFRALGAWIRGEHDRAKELLEEQRQDRHLAYGLGRDLLAWIDVAARKYDDAADRFVEALDAFESMEVPDQSARSNSVLGLAVIVVETIDLRYSERLRVECDRLPWNEGTRRRLFHAGHYLVRLDALVGNDDDAFTRATNLLRSSQRDGELLMSHVTLAEFFRVRGDRVSPPFHLRSARDALRSERWSSTDVDDAMAALLFAVEASHVDQPAAAEALTRVLSSSGRTDAMLAFEHDSRARALAFFARGRVAIAQGHDRDGEELVGRARGLWADHGYRYRVALADLELADTFENRAALEASRATLADVPRSWLAKRAESVQRRLTSGLADLSPAERRVLRELRAGKTNREIAETLQKSESTIRNQTQHIFDVLGINSRAALVARLSELYG
ncbi:MAG TPA: LuxR C-terminal-related transcriptional regulator [Candidatus Limnocylindria bacterium]|nr:LuxR C-terminal-related transcriptional regulator [Candidatus Limnocylindria bacterium]